MKIPLLLGARPKFASKGPLVSLKAGRWIITCEGIADTKLLLAIKGANNNSPSPLPSFIELNVVTFVELTFDYRGNENSINVFAELKNAA